MLPENSQIEYKSLRKVEGPKADLTDLAETCVCLANAQGGTIIIGVEDKENEPSAGQVIAQELVNSTITRLQALTSGVGLANSEILKHKNGGQYFQFRVLPTSQTIAVTSKGKVFVRVADQCLPIGGNDLTRLAAERNAFQWEVAVRPIAFEKISSENIDSFIKDIRKSDRVKEFVKEKMEVEILEHYHFVEEGSMTNLGILWLGTPAQRRKLAYPITVEYIVYDDLDNKVRKEHWHDADLNPKELILEVEKQAVELKYSYELPDGLFRKKIPFYDSVVIRELLVNAIAHKSYVISNDITIRVYPDSMTIISPGSLPLGVTKDNILHKKERRNPHLIRVLHDLGLMEGEGSGYDLIYEILGRDVKKYPIIKSDFSTTSVQLLPQIEDRNVLLVMDFVLQSYPLRQREVLTLGVIARHQKILATRLSKMLQLPDDERLRSYTSVLLEEKIIQSRGAKKGTEFLISPAIISGAKINQRPTLKTVEPHVLEALLIEDLRAYHNSKISEIHARMSEVMIEDLTKSIYRMVKDGKLQTEGGRKDRTYKLA